MKVKLNLSHPDNPREWKAYKDLEFDAFTSIFGWTLFWQDDRQQIKLYVSTKEQFICL